MRHLATVRKILELNPIPEADAIEVATVDGWKVVVKKNEFAVGDLCVYFEIDSFLPDGNPAWQHLVDKHPRIFEGKKGHRLKTVKLRGQVSQGFLIPLSRELEISWSHTFFNFEGARPLQLGDDLTDLLYVKKWEAPIPTEIAGQVRGNFPIFIKRTDQERCCDGSTIIETEDGPKTIKTICEMKYAGKVKSFNHNTGIIEYKNITNWSIMSRKRHTWLKIITKSGKEITVTGNHMIWVDELQCYRRADELVIGNKFIIKTE